MRAVFLSSGGPLQRSQRNCPGCTTFASGSDKPNNGPGDRGLNSVEKGHELIMKGRQASFFEFQLFAAALLISLNRLICFQITSKYNVWGCNMNKDDFERMPLNGLWNLHERIRSALEKRIKDEKRKLEHRLNELVRKFDGTPAGIRQHKPHPGASLNSETLKIPRSPGVGGEGIHAG